ncbi:MAG: MFS transporter [Aestuariivita sp.]|nr:MFS transporter [Aestuariivita sp.]
MRMIVSFSALFLSVALLQFSSGGVGPLDALSGLALDFSTEQIGLLGSAHFVGFFIGCWWAPRLMGTVGQSRTFAAFTAAGAIGLIAHMIIIDPYAWALMRIATGMCIAGCYTVIESWIQAKATNENRGRTLGAYRFIDMGASFLAQMAISVLEPASYISYNILAIICCLALLPLTLTRTPPPETPNAPRIHPLRTIRRLPLSTAAVIVAALSGASFRMVGPIYGIEVGLSVDQIAWFLAAFVLGGAIAQYPVGWLADKFDRRWVMIGLSIATVISCGAMVATHNLGTIGVLLTAVFFGLTSFPIYSVAAAHAHDFTESQERIELSASLMFWFAAGAIAAPLLASALISSFGPAALFIMIAIGHLILIIFAVIRMRARPTQSLRTRFIYVPRTSFIIGHLLKRDRLKNGR